MRRFQIAAWACALMLIACSDNSDPFADDPDRADGGSGGSGADAAGGGGGIVDAASRPDAEPLDCAPAPSRLVVLGDSIAACSGVGGKTGANCSARKYHDHLEARFGSTIAYQNLSVPGAVTAGVVNDQLATIDDGEPGHVVVLIYIGGNDLQPYIFISDQAAQNRFDSDMPRILGHWDTILDYFDDSERFPDGVTVMMNTQYNPFDDCTASPYNLSALNIDLLHQFNDNLKTLADARANVVITDQHASYLGHGHHYNVTSCPHYQPGLASWMADLIHPNVAGHAHLADEWQATADRMYSACQ